MVITEEGFQRRRDANFLLRSDAFVTAKGPPRVLVRNYEGYGCLGRAHENRWGVWDRGSTAFDLASSFLKDRRDICVPVELLTDIIDEDSKLKVSARCPNFPDTMCSDLEWPGSCLEHLNEDPASLSPGSTDPLLIHASGPQNSHLSLLRPTFKANVTSEKSYYGATDSIMGTEAAAIRGGESLDLYSGQIRQIAAVVPRSGVPRKVFARCNYSATLVGISGDLDNLCRSASAPPAGEKLYRRKLRRARAAEAAVSGEEVPDGSSDDDHQDECVLVEQEKLVFAKRPTCVACSHHTPARAAFLDEEFRLFQWHANRGAVMHGPGPLQLPPISSSGSGPGSARSPAFALARRATNADVALDYGHHPCVLWMAAKHRAFRLDLRERPTPNALAPVLDPGAYFARNQSGSILEGGRRSGGRGETPRIRTLAVGRRSVSEVFVAAGLFLACMDVRFPRDVVARWDLPHEMNQLRWLRGLPGEGVDAEEVLLASGRRSAGYHLNTWASDAPGWRGCQIRLGLDDASSANSAAKRPLTFSLPATALAEGETRSGGVIVAVPPKHERLLFVYATSVGDVYSQAVEVHTVGGADRQQNSRRAELATHDCPLFSRRIQSMLPCGEACLDEDGDLETSLVDKHAVDEARRSSDCDQASKADGSKAQARQEATGSSAVQRRAQSFPVNADALRAMMERARPGSLCTHRLLPSVAELVKSGEDEGRTAEAGEGRVSALAPSQRREEDFGNLRDFKEDLAVFLRTPRTQDELLLHCRRELELAFPEDPQPSSPMGRGNDEVASRNMLAGSGHGVVRKRKRVDDRVIAADLVRAILAWGAPFRKVETLWTPAVPAQGFTVLSEGPQLVTRVPTSVVCSAPKIARAKPSPLLGPGVVGEPLACDVTVEDVKWLKDQWEAL